MTLVLVRHAEPEVSPLDDPRSWPLSTTGREAASQLHDRLPDAGRWFSSTERKAYETLLYAGGSSVRVDQDPRFDEVGRDEPFDSEFKTRRRAWVEGHLDERHAGWESPQEAAERFDLALREYANATEALVVATHGMVLTAWLVHGLRSLSELEAGSFWEQMRFPDVVRVDGRLARRAARG